MKIKKRAITLIEIMIVMFLIAIITAAVAINITGSLDEGKAFKTRTNIEKLENILNLMVSDNPDLTNSIANDWEEKIKRSPLVADPTSLSKDGWGVKYQVFVEDGVVRVLSPKFEEYKKTHQTLFK